MQQKVANTILTADGQKLELGVEGLSTLGIQVVGTMSATVQIEGTIDGTNWFALNSIPWNSGTPVTSLTAAGVWFANVAGILSVRLRCSAYTSGSPTMAMIAVSSGIAEQAGVTGLVSLIAGEIHIGEVGGKTVRSTVEFTRTTGTTGYDANDIVLPATPALVEIPNVGRILGGSGYITEIRVSTNKKSITPRFRIHFFNASNPTISADGANWQDKYADIAKRVGYWDMPALSTAADTSNSDMSRSMDASMRLPFVCVAGTSLYYAIETLDAFTPADSQKFSISLYVEQN